MNNQELNFLHFDMDAFYASCEILENPSYKHLPMVVGRNSKRSIVTTANYEARKYGIHSAMPIYRAKSLAKDLVIVEPDLKKYRKKSEEVFKALSMFSDKIEKKSIDEGVMDISHLDIERYKLARLVQDNIFAKTRLSISIGISFNMSMAKLACDWNKPHGIKIIEKDQVPDILRNLDIGKIYGIGKVSKEKLNRIGIYKVDELLKLSLSEMRKILGKNPGTIIYDRIRGIDKRTLDLSHIRKSLGVEKTFFDDIADINALLKYVNSFAEELESDLKAKGFYFKTLTVKIKYRDFQTISRSISLVEYVNKKEDIERLANYLLTNMKLERPVRLLGISLSNLRNVDIQQLKFF